MTVTADALAQTPIGTPSMPTLVNRAVDPGMQSNISGAQASATTATYTLSYDTTVFHSGTQSALLTRTTSTLNNILGVLNMSPGTNGHACKVLVTPGETISVSCWVRVANAATTAQARIQVLWKDNTGTQVGATLSGPYVLAIPMNTWTLIKYEGLVVPATASWVTLQSQATITTGNAVGGELVWTDDLMVNSGATVQPYMDGSQPGCIWVSGANRSLSIKGIRSLAQINRCLDPSMEASAITGWASVQGTSNSALHVLSYDTATKRSGTRSLLSTRQAATPNNTVASLYYAPMGTTNAQPLSVFVTPGETISTGVWMRCSVANWRGQIQVFWRDATGAAQSSSVGPVVGGAGTFPANTWVWITYEGIVVPAGAVMALFLGVAFGPTSYTSVGGELTWYDDAVINAGVRVQQSWDAVAGMQWLSGVQYIGPAVRPLGPWSQWDSVVEQPLDYAGEWDGSALQQVALATVGVQ